MKALFIVALSVCFLASKAQDVNTMLKEASNLEKQFKEADALQKYMQVADADPKNITALVKCTELNCSIGAKQKDIPAKSPYYNAALVYAQKAYAADSNNFASNYAMALVAGKMTEIADENKQIVAWVRQTKLYADKAVMLNPNDAKSNYVLGKWHYEMVNLSWAKKAAVKVIYGGLPKGDIDSAIFYMEKCRKLDQYFVRNYLDLAKAYQYNNRAALELDVLTKLVKLPNRTADDAALKAEGQKMLDTMQ